MKFESPETFAAFSLKQIAECGGPDRNTILSRLDTDDPGSLEEAFRKGAYRAFADLLLHPENAEKIRAKSIADRQSHAPLFEKLTQIAGISSHEKQLVLSLADADPETFFGKTIAEKNPHLVIEGLLIAARIAQVEEVLIYVDERDQTAVELLKKASQDAEACGLAGQRILGTDFSVRIRFRIGMQNVMHMDDSAFKASLNGRRVEPVYPDPYPHTYLFSAEALVKLPIAMESEAEIPLLFALTGKISAAGMTEISSDATLRTLIDPPAKRTFKAALIGDAYYDENDLDSEVFRLDRPHFGYDEGNIAFLDADDCIVQSLRFTLSSLYEETCGKCTPCRIGVMQILETLDRFIAGKGTEEEMRRLKELALYIRRTSLCAVGKKAAGIVLSALEKFEDEFRAHIAKKCPAGSCKALVEYRIVTANCLGCGMCARNCPVNAISKTDLFGKNPRLNAYEIDATKCVKCGTCLTKCPAKPKAIVR